MSVTSADRIEHVVIIVKENHSFDNYFGRFPGVDGDPTLGRAADPPGHDPPHDHADWLSRAAHAPRVAYAEHDVPAYWSYARDFTLCERYFTDVAGPSTPNHLMLIAADTPLIDNPWSPGPQPQPPYDLRSLPRALEQAGHDWRHYGEGYAINYITELRGSPNARPPQQFVVDALAGNLPAVCWVYGPDLLDEHPLGSVARGSAWTAGQVDAVVAGGRWPAVAIFITFDDYGGWFDHVNPPEVETWKDGTQFRYGSRVPCLVLSPYAKSGHVSSVLHSHVSLTKFCEVTFGLPPLTGRDAAADDMSDCFDFGRAPAGPPPRWRTLGRWAQPAGGGAAQNVTGRLEVVARGTDNRLRHIGQRTAGGRWAGWGALGLRLTGSPAIATNADGRLEAFGRGPDGALHHVWQVAAGRGWKGGGSPGLKLVGDPVVGRNLDGRLEAFARGAGGALHHLWQRSPGGKWLGGGALGLHLVGTPAVARNADGRLEVFGRGADGALHHIWQTAPGGRWSASHSLGGALAGDPAVAQNADGRLEVFARGPDKAVHHAWQAAPGGTWSGWHSLGGALVGDPMIAQNADGRLEAFGRAGNQALHHAWQTAPNGSWSKWRRLGGGLSGDPVVTANLDGRLEVFGLGPRRALRHLWQKAPGGAWSRWSSLGGKLASL